MRQYVAFFRGLNVTGKNALKMSDLKKTLESIGCTNVKTVLASGNAIFTAPQDLPKTLQQKIETELAKGYDYKGNVILRPIETLHSLMNANPFSSIETSPDTRLYVTFLPTPPESHAIEQLENFSVIHTTDTEVFSVLTLSPNSKTVDVMKILDNAYGKTITTRNWNTIKRMVGAL